MSSLPYLHTAGYFIKYGSIVTLFTNSLLIYLTVTKIKTIHFTYKCLIVLMAVLGVTFSLLELLINPFIHSFNSSFIYFSASKASEKTLRLSLVCCYSTTYMIVICCLAIQFIYRYLVLLSPKFINLFNGWKAIIWVFYGAFCTVLWVIALSFIAPDAYSQDYLRMEMEENYKVNIDNIASYQLVAYDNNGLIRTRNFIGLCSLTSILVFQYVLIIFFGVKTHFGIKQIVALQSAKNHKLHAQLFKTLVLQITIPSIFYNSPVFILYLIPYLDITISCPSGLMICFFCLYPATDSVIMMWMVKEYKKIIKKALGAIVAMMMKWSEIKNEDSSTEERTEMRRI